MHELEILRHLPNIVFVMFTKLIEMSRISSLVKLGRQVSQLQLERARFLSSNYNTMLQSPIKKPSRRDEAELPNNETVNESSSQIRSIDVANVPRRPIGGNISRKDKISFLKSTLTDLEDSKVAIYTTLDAWVAWEQNFPIGPLKHILADLEKEQQWRRVIQVIKWMLSKGQGTTQGTYYQLIKALDKDNRVQEAHEIWQKKLAYDLHSVPWKLCSLMISIYYRNNMMDELVKLFKGLGSFDRKPPEKSIVQKVANAYELLGFPVEKEQILEKYKNLFDESFDGKSKKLSQNHSTRKGGKPKRK